MTMETMDIESRQTRDTSSPIIPFARSYQVEALERAIKQNTIVYLETGSGKTLVAIMLLKWNSYLLRKPSSYIAVFLVPTVVLVKQQAEAIRKLLDLRVGEYYGEMQVDWWDATTWSNELENHEVLVMTPMILLNALRHSYVKINHIKVLIFDKCHNAGGKHPYACIMKEFYRRQLSNRDLPAILRMTTSPIKAKGRSSSSYWNQISELENLLNSKVYTCESESALASCIPFANVKLKFYDEVNVSHMLSKRLEDDLGKLLVKHISSERILQLDKAETGFYLQEVFKATFCLFVLFGRTWSMDGF